MNDRDKTIAGLVAAITFVVFALRFPDNIAHLLRVFGG